MSYWADIHIGKLEDGEHLVRFRPRGNSMTPLVQSGDLVEVRSLIGEYWVPNLKTVLQKGDIVLCKVGGRVYLHKVLTVAHDGRVQIGNNHGKVNGWTKTVYGILNKIIHENE